MTDHHIDINYRRLGKPIPVEEAGLRLDRYLGQKFLFHSRCQWQVLIEEKKVFINGATKKVSYSLQKDDQITYFQPIEGEPPVDDRIYVLWEDPYIMAVYKTPGIPMHEGGPYRLNTFCEVLKNKFGSEWAPVHRLDRETSGIVLCAKSTYFRNLVAETFRSHKIQKTYYAIGRNIPSRKTWTTIIPLGRIPSNIQRLRHGYLENGSFSKTHFEVLEEKNSFCLMKVMPVTGRTHQIRIHAQLEGHVLVGDKKYCADESIYVEYMDKGFTKRVQEASITERLCLHAGEISFIHPILKTNVTVICPIPEDMKKIWESL